MPFRQLKSFLKILIGVQYYTQRGGRNAAAFCYALSSQMLRI